VVANGNKLETMNGHRLEKTALLSVIQSDWHEKH